MTASAPMGGVEVVDLTITRARVRMWLRNIKVRALSKATGIEENRLTRILYKRKGYPPTAEELESLARELSLSQRAVLADATAVLERALNEEPGEAEAPTGQPAADPHDIETIFARIPGAMKVFPVRVFSYIAAGGLDDAESVVEEEPIYLTEDVLKLGHIEGVRVRGWSMVDAGIDDGDAVAVLITHEAKDGQIVVVRIENACTVKRLRVSGAKRWLASESPHHKDIPITGAGIEIIGVVVAIVKKPRPMAPPKKRRRKP